jgi:hypothetical protein
VQPVRVVLLGEAGGGVEGDVVVHKLPEIAVSGWYCWIVQIAATIRLEHLGRTGTDVVSLAPGGTHRVNLRNMRPNGPMTKVQRRTVTSRVVLPCGLAAPTDAPGSSASGVVPDVAPSAPATSPSPRPAEVANPASPLPQCRPTESRGRRGLQADR